ncbi:HipA domain-containing protein [Sulfurimonas sp. SWIR-19]|uniref:type II toxin-antitoxin system HipA family toxin n=1 Tax=Sulfurimonas sp. SWIR-19 TaxID=2878390 RepID=UPI001CF50236|nr:HipA domain-containing protein [Sulfurimonas sp. SWIR-19]UCN01320.1 HipA domain-containing protein [Sulfurimonas sp. SWIR-19]
MINIFIKEKHIASFIQDKNSYLIDYKDFDIKNSITLSLPNTKRFYTYEHRFPPYFETFLPEGYLYEVFKNLLTKEYGYIDDYLIFSKLAPNIDARVSFKSDYKRLDFSFLDIDSVLENDSNDTFSKLLEMFLNKNAISGVQPKTVALLKNKETLHRKEYIIKTWGDEFPNLAENEYFCLQACKKAGIQIPNIQLSKNKKFLVVENFIFRENEIFGFEEILSLMDKNKTQKYSGSYEQVAKIIYQFTTNKQEALQEYFKIVVMNYLLKNGDAHLKNFGLLFSDDFSMIRLSPAYDIVNTTAYIFKDKPALTLGGKKVWWGKESLVDFGVKNCLLRKKEALVIYKECVGAVEETITDITSYIKENPDFKTIGIRMCDSFKISLQDKTIKELPLELTRTWNQSKRA